ncbi:MAG: rhodanese-like domain-containing protein, partial [Betaproteobacteria bacterium]
MFRSNFFARIAMSAASATATLGLTLAANCARPPLVVALACMMALSSGGEAATQPLPSGSPANGATALPDKLPGGKIVTTEGVLELSRRHIPVHFVDVSGESKTLPNTISAAWLVPTEPDSYGRSLDDFLYRVTHQNRHAPVTFFGSGPQSRGAYDLAVQAIRLGYRGVRWYRGGIEAWRRDGQHLMPARLIPRSDKSVWGHSSWNIEAPSVPTSTSFEELTYLERENMAVAAPVELRGEPLQGPTPN